MKILEKGGSIVAADKIRKYQRLPTLDVGMQSK